MSRNTHETIQENVLPDGVWHGQQYQDAMEAQKRHEDWLLQTTPKGFGRLEYVLDGGCVSSFIILSNFNPAHTTRFEIEFTDHELADKFADWYSSMQCYEDYGDTQVAVDMESTSVELRYSEKIEDMISVLHLTIPADERFRDKSSKVIQFREA
jgi:hypothetical protein